MRQQKESLFIGMMRDSIGVLVLVPGFLLFCMGISSDAAAQRRLSDLAAKGPRLSWKYFPEVCGFDREMMTRTSLVLDAVEEPPLGEVDAGESYRLIYFGAGGREVVIVRVSFRGHQSTLRSIRFHMGAVDSVAESLSVFEYDAMRCQRGKIVRKKSRELDDLGRRLVREQVKDGRFWQRPEISSDGGNFSDVWILEGIQLDERYHLVVGGGDPQHRPFPNLGEWLLLFDMQ